MRIIPIFIIFIAFCAPTFAQGEDSSSLSEDEQASCEAMLCLMAEGDEGGDDEQCDEALEEYYAIAETNEDGTTNQEETVSEREAYLDQCPPEVSGGGEGHDALIASLAADLSDIPSSSIEPGAPSSEPAEAPSGGAASGASSDGAAAGSSSGSDAMVGNDRFSGTGTLASTGTLWKPVSEGDGNLVILTPSNYAQHDIAVYGPNGNLIARGLFIGATNGNRATYRFDRPGGAFPAPAIVQIGEGRYTVANPSARNMP